MITLRLPLPYVAWASTVISMSLGACQAVGFQTGMPSRLEMTPVVSGVGSASVLVRPLLVDAVDRRILVVVPNLKKTDIDHIDLELFRGAVTTGQTASLAIGAFGKGVTFGNVRNGVTYTVKAQAFTTGGTLISASGALSEATFVVPNSTPQVSVDLRVRLSDVAFSGTSQGTPFGVIEGDCLGAFQGLVSTWAGGGSAGWMEGSGSAASFSGPAGLATEFVNNQDFVYVAETANHAIRRIDNGRNVSTLAGLGPSSPGFTDGDSNSARFNEPVAIAVGANGTLYVADRGNFLVREVTQGQTLPFVSTLAGVVSDAGYENNPTGPSSKFSTTLGGLAIAPDGTKLYVADSGNHCIRTIDLSDGSHFVTTLAGLAPGASQIGAFADGDSATARFNDPRGLAFGKNGLLYVADSQNRRIRKIDTTKLPTDPQFVTTLAGGAEDAFIDGSLATARFNEPSAVVELADGTILVSDLSPDGNRLRQIKVADGLVTTPVGASGGAGIADGMAEDAQLGIVFGTNAGVAVDSHGNIFLSDSANNRIRKIQ